MPQFHYQALNAAQQMIAGKLEAPSVAQAIAQLEAEGLIVQSITRHRNLEPSVGPATFHTNLFP